MNVDGIPDYQNIKGNRNMKHIIHLLHDYERNMKIITPWKIVFSEGTDRRLFRVH